MALLKTTKLKMTQLFKGDEAVPVTPLRFAADADITPFKEGAKVMVSGITKGRGFQGVVKRHGFHGGPKTHGQKNRHRAPGSIGNTTPQRVLPGRRMAGHMGMDRVTIKNLKVVEIDTAQHLLYVRGAVPGNRNRIVEVRIAN